jgi:glycosyltransferase involved in cell wall biosynthesis
VLDAARDGAQPLKSPDLAGRLQRARPRIRRLLPAKLHHLAGHLGRWAVRAIEARGTMPPIGPPALLPGPAATAEARRPPIVLANASLTAGGAERQVVNLLQGLTRRGRHALLLTLHLDERPELRFFLDEAVAAGLEVRNAQPAAQAAEQLIAACGTPAYAAFRDSLAWAPGDIQDDIVRLAGELHRLRPAVVHGWQDATGIVAAFAALAVGARRIIIGGRNLQPEHFSHARPYMRDAYRFLAGRSEVVLANNSAAGARSYADWLGLEPGVIRVVRNGIAAEALTRPRENDIEAFRRSLGVAAGGRLVGGAFRLQAEKRPLLWLEAAARVSRRHPDVRFVIFGEGTMRGKLGQAAERLGLADKLMMPGTIGNSRLAIATLDVLMLASAQEGTPNVVLEATCLGVPVVAINAGGTGETLLEGRTGLLVQEEDTAPEGLADGLAKAVAQVLAGRFAPGELRTLGPEFIKQAFGIERMVEETLALYE